MGARKDCSNLFLNDRVIVEFVCETAGCELRDVTVLSHSGTPLRGAGVKHTGITRSSENA
jgi:hypothetical protein